MFKVIKKLQTYKELSKRLKSENIQMSRAISILVGGYRRVGIHLYGEVTSASLNDKMDNFRNSLEYYQQQIPELMSEFGYKSKEELINDLQVLKDARHSMQVDNIKLELGK